MNAPVPLPPREVVVRYVLNPDPLRINTWRGLRALAQFADEIRRHEEQMSRYRNPPVRPEPSEVIPCAT